MTALFTTADFSRFNNRLLFDDHRLLHDSSLTSVFVMAQRVLVASLLRHLAAKGVSEASSEKRLIPLFVRADQLWSTPPDSAQLLVTLQALVSSALSSVGQPAMTPRG